jgi:hypothetical protein
MLIGSCTGRAGHRIRHAWCSLSVLKQWSAVAARHHRLRAEAPRWVLMLLIGRQGPMTGELTSSPPHKAPIRPVAVRSLVVQMSLDTATEKQRAAQFPQLKFHRKKQSTEQGRYKCSFRARLIALMLS